MIAEFFLYVVCFTNVIDMIHPSIHYKDYYQMWTYVSVCLQIFGDRVDQFVNRFTMNGFPEIRRTP